MKLSYLFLCLCVLTILPKTHAQTSTGSASTGAAASGSISDISFISGSWKAVAGDRSIDAVWSSPVGESITGYVRVMKDGKVVLYELFAFEQSEHGLVALVRHFGPGLVAWEEKENPNHYRFLQAEKGRALFEKQGEEVRVRYEKRSENEFAIVIGKPQEGKWVFKDFWVFSRVSK